MLRTIVAVLLSLLTAHAASAAPPAIVGYFGPVKATVADPRQAGTPTAVSLTALYFQEDQAFTIKACTVIVNTYGPSVGDPRIEVSQVLVNAAFPVKLNGVNCAALLVPGLCVQVYGHVLAQPDLLGQSWIADAFSRPANCP